jgi:hypothetical protein
MFADMLPFVDSQCSGSRFASRQPLQRDKPAAISVQVRIGMNLSPTRAGAHYTSACSTKHHSGAALFGVLATVLRHSLMPKPLEVFAV